MNITDLLKCEVNIVVDNSDKDRMSQLQGYFFHVNISVNESAEIVSGILLLDQAIDNSEHDSQFIATLWLDNKSSVATINEQAFFAIELVREFELLHLLMEEKSLVANHLPITCKAQLSVCATLNQTSHSMNNLHDEFLLRK